MMLTGDSLSFLILPEPCSTTIRGQSSLQALDRSLNRTSLWDTLDHSPNVTCLAPTNDAFSSAGSPDQNLNSTSLSGALMFHTLPFPLYSPYIVSGMVVKSAAGLDVIVTITDGGDIYFNDAKVISPNVFTNNGLIHVLDKVMSPNGTAPLSSSSTATSTVTSTASSTASTSASASATTSANAAAGARTPGNSPGGFFLGLVAAVAMLL
jgi:transforming growth factor-beta-induced protein